MDKKKKFITCDGNYAAAHVAYMFSEVAAIYPITPSSNMAEYVDEWSSHGRKNIFGDPVTVSEMQSEGGAAGAVHGSLQAGALTSTFTASQGLLLMLPNMYKIAGELLPGVFHVSARSLAAQALSIFGDHSDVMSARMTGFAMLASGSVQEVMDLAGVAHLAAIRGRVPFMHFFDGFRTSHEIQKVELMSQDDLEPLLDRKALQRFRDNAMNPENPVTRGTAQNPDIYFQSRESANPFYARVADNVEDYMAQINRITGREYHPFTYYGHPEAENIIVAMGSVTETIRETIDYLAAQGKKLGLVTVHLYRPFSEKYFFRVLPKSVRRIAVLDRTKEPGAMGEPLYLDVRNLFYGKAEAPLIVGGRYGLSSKDTLPSHVIAVIQNLEMPEPKNGFTLGIVDDVSFLSLPELPKVNVSPKGTFEAKFYGIGSDGTVGANKNSIMIIGESTDKYAQAYFAYDSKKSGGITTSHLRFGDVPIRATYLVANPDFVACHVPSYIWKYDMLKGLKDGGTFLMNSIWDVETTLEKLPNSMKKYMADHQIKFYLINATQLARDLGLGNRTNTIMQAAFFKIANVIPYEEADRLMKRFIVKSFGRKGEEVVNMNNRAIDSGADNVVLVEVPQDWKELSYLDDSRERDLPDFIKNIVEPINALKGDDLPVSAFLGREDGTFPPGTAAYEKRGIAVSVPEWQPEHCIQCNICAYVCPHACIRPFLISPEEKAEAPGDMVTVPAKGKMFKGLEYRIQLSPMDCTGCDNCVQVCPTKNKSLVMKPLEDQLVEKDHWEFLAHKTTPKAEIIDEAKHMNVQISQFAQPLFEFSGACSGCGETPYIKLITQLFGDRMMIANATGCSSIYGGSAPATPYTTNHEGRGPAWGNSLFEDNAEYGFGMHMAGKVLRQRLQKMMAEGTNGKGEGLSDELKELFRQWLESKEDGAKTKTLRDQMVPLLEAEKDHALAAQVLELKQYITKASTWIIGGDGWAYDIGYGGLDHVLASGENVNVLVLDTEVYSNTGGQSSKSTPVGAVAKFAASGKRIRKKDLGTMAMTYGYVYVAQVAMGANNSQFFKAVKEAEAYDGPSLIIAYSPCISHGIHSGMQETQEQELLAVEAGYWHLYRYNPLNEKIGRNPFKLDSRTPQWDKFKAFLNREVRYTSLRKTFPEVAEELFDAAEENARWRYESYKRYESMDFSSMVKK